MNSRNGAKVILFLLSPVISAIHSICHIQERASQILLYGWFLVFGCAFCALNEGADSFRWVETFQIEHNYTLAQYKNLINEYFTFDSNIKDIYATTVNFIVGGFTDNYHWTYLIYASVFGWFYLQSLKFFLRYEINRKAVFYALLFILCFSNPIFNINGMRFWTASWIGVYVTLHFFIDKNWKVLPLLFLLPLIHGSSSIWVIFIIISFLTIRFQKIWIALFIISSFVSALSSLDVVRNYSDLLPQFMQNQLWAYTESKDALERIARETQINGYWDILNSLPKYFMLLMTYLLILSRKQINSNVYNKRLLTIIISLSAITNFVSGVPSMNRFQLLCVPILVVFWSMNYNTLKRYNFIFRAVPIVYAYGILYWIRNMISVTQIELYVLPTPITIVKYLLLS